MPVKAQKDPRAYDWVELANISRCWLEPLVRSEAGWFATAVLLRAWRNDMRHIALASNPSGLR
jgi:peptide/nickel transport system substrate-binding protein